MCVTLCPQLVFDCHPGDVYACVADIGWITGHSYVVYGPLCNGVTSVLFESSPVYPNAGERGGEGRRGEGRERRGGKGKGNQSLLLFLCGNFPFRSLLGDGVTTSCDPALPGAHRHPHAVPLWGELGEQVRPLLTACAGQR